jgi:hypothetical protein
MADDEQIAEHSTTVLVGETVLDEETGEILEWPAGVSDRLEYLATQHRNAAEQEKGWGVQKGFWSRLLDRALSEAGTKKHAGATFIATSVASTTLRSAPAEAVVDARAAELITDSEATDLLLRAAKVLDTDEVEQWIGEQDEPRRKPLRLALIKSSTRRGYVLTKPVLQAAPSTKKGRG